MEKEKRKEWRKKHKVNTSVVLNKVKVKVNACNVILFESCKLLRNKIMINDKL